jgi:hypothetical protein
MTKRWWHVLICYPVINWLQDLGGEGWGGWRRIRHLCCSSNKVPRNARLTRWCYIKRSYQPTNATGQRPWELILHSASEQTARVLRNLTYVTVFTKARHQALRSISWHWYFISSRVSARPTANFKDHTLSAVHDCLFSRLYSTQPSASDRRLLHWQPEVAPCRSDKRLI